MQGASRSKGVLGCAPAGRRCPGTPRRNASPGVRLLSPPRPVCQRGQGRQSRRLQLSGSPCPLGWWAEGAGGAGGPGGVSLPTRWSCAPRFAAAAGWLGASSGLLLLGPELRRRDPGFPVGKRLTPCTDVLTPLSPPAQQHSQSAIPPGGGVPRSCQFNPRGLSEPREAGVRKTPGQQPSSFPSPRKGGSCTGSVLSSPPARWDAGGAREAAVQEIIAARWRLNHRRERTRG